MLFCKIFLNVRVDTFSPFAFQCYICLFCVVVIQFFQFSRSHMFPSFPFWFLTSFFFATFRAHTFPPNFPIVVFTVFFVFVLSCFGLSKVIPQCFSNCVLPFHFGGGGKFDFGIVSPKFL